MQYIFTSMLRLLFQLVFSALSIHLFSVHTTIDELSVVRSIQSESLFLMFSVSFPIFSIILLSCNTLFSPFIVFTYNSCLSSLFPWLCNSNTSINAESRVENIVDDLMHTIQNVHVHTVTIELCRRIRFLVMLKGLELCSVM